MDPALAIALGVFLFLSFTTTILIVFACALSSRISRLEEGETVYRPIEDAYQPAYESGRRYARRPA